jgi:hypothetical protein
MSIFINVMLVVSIHDDLKKTVISAGGVAFHPHLTKSILLKMDSNGDT